MFSNEFMTLPMSECEELGAPRWVALQVPRDEAVAGDEVTRKVALQPVQVSSSTLTDAPHALCILFLA